MRVGLVVAEGSFTSGVSALLDVLGAAEGSRRGVDDAIAPIELVVAGFRRNVTTSAGLRVPTVCRPDELEGCDAIVVPALGAKDESSVPTFLGGRDVKRLLRLLPALRESTPTLGAACTGVFPLAESGVLDGRRVTTTWWLAGAFRRRYPRVQLDLDAMLVMDSGLLTAGAAFAHIDLALALVRRASATLAEHVARLLVVEERAAQSVYVALDHLSSHDPLVVAFERHVRSNLGDALDVSEVATAVGASRRTLERRVGDALGMTPLALVQRVRVERATHLLRTTDQTMDQIAGQVGYANASTLRSLLRRFR